MSSLNGKTKFIRINLLFLIDDAERQIEAATPERDKMRECGITLHTTKPN
jgi:hypothetical protein